MFDNEKIIRAFIADWSNLDPAQLVNYFTEDGVYHNMPIQPVAGKDKLLGFIGGFLANWTTTDWEIINIATTDNLVMVERVDHTTVGDKVVHLPCFGVFEMQAGKIRVWRDYFDMNTFQAAFK